MRRAVSEECHIRAGLQNRKRTGDDYRMRILRGQERDDRRSVVLDARTTDFMKLGVKQLLQASFIAANPRVMEFHFKCAEMMQ